MVITYHDKSLKRNKTGNLQINRILQSDKTKVTFLAKTKTAMQMLSILMYLFGLMINNMMVLFFADIILIIALLVTIQTGFQYTISTFKK